MFENAIRLLLVSFWLAATAAEAASGKAPGINWRVPADAPIRAAPAVAGNVLVFGSSDGVLHAIDRVSGEGIWFKNLGDPLESVPAIDGNVVVVAGRQVGLHAVDLRTGNILWTHRFNAPLRFRWGWDYLLSSPVVNGDSVYVGSRDGVMASYGLKDGKKAWEFKIAEPILASPTLAGDRLLFGGTDGVFYCLSSKTGKLIWSFRTEGADIDLKAAGFDRRSILSTAAVSEDTAFFGSRDGHVYAVAVADGKKRWVVDDGIPWIEAGVARYKDTIIVGDSDGRFVQAIDQRTGRELWKSKLDSNVLAAPTIVNDETLVSTTGSNMYDLDAATGDMVMVGKWRASAGSIYALDARDGHVVWRTAIGDSIFSSPKAAPGSIYVGADDGFLYSLKPGDQTAKPPLPAARAVYWNTAPTWRWFKNHAAVKDYFVSAGYELLDDEGVVRFLADRISDRRASVIVFASDVVPAGLLVGAGGAATLRTYLDAGGKVVWIGAPPGFWSVDSATGKGNADARAGTALLGVNLAKSSGDDKWAQPTTQGHRWGLRRGWIGTNDLPTSEVDTVLATDVDGNAAGWVKRFSGPDGTGFVRLWGRPDGIPDLSDMLRVAEFGMPQ